MKWRSGSVLVAVVISLSCGVAMPARGQQKNDVDSILSGFPGYHLLTLKERDADTQAFILQHFPKANTSVVHADFDGDGFLDYAMLLKSDRLAAAKLVVLLCDAKGQCRNVYESDITGYSDGAYLRPFPLGSKISPTDAAGTQERSSTVTLKAIGIQVVYFEKGRVVLYWDKKVKKVTEVPTGE
jgi:hypothetical protein